MVSLSLLQSVSARQMFMFGRKVTHFYFNVRMCPSHEGPPGWAESSLEWLQEWNVYAICWHPDSPYWYEGREAFPPEEYTVDDVYVCHGDWCMGCELYKGTFRYQWWIIWESVEAAGEEGAKSLGGYFIFSGGTKVFSNMWAVGEAWVEMDPGEYYPVGWQYHEGWICAPGCLRK